jgi:hypothetical protein
MTVSVPSCKNDRVGAQPRTISARVTTDDFVVRKDLRQEGLLSNQVGLTSGRILVEIDDCVVEKDVRREGLLGNREGRASGKQKQNDGC